ncbi:recombinase family protein [uncultured Reyranella sp.]|uniref:recombinase family protein n=1 Tax=uncultured Reyranella sp. TaxID=735512 RepID=UPI0025DB8783|nr:recombinase family protein [uncultured Reyranella sp.]
MAATSKPKRAALYLRVSTDRQTVENQRQALEAVAAHREWEIVTAYSDKGISGAKGRKDRPEFDRMLNDAQRGLFDVIMVFALDRIGRSLGDLLKTIEHLKECRVDLFIVKFRGDGETLDTTTAGGKLLFHITGAFAEFERDMIVQRVNAGLDRARAKGVTLGRPRIDKKVEEAIRKALAKGDKGKHKLAAEFGVGSGTVARIKAALAARKD